MKFSGLALLATTASAAVLEARQVEVVQGVLTKVQDQIEAVDKTVKAYTSGDTAAVESAGKTLISTIDGSVSKVEAIKELELQAALGLTDPVTSLTESSSTLVTDLKAKKSAVEKASKCKAAQQLVNGVNDSSEKLIKAVVSKVPEDAQSIADKLVADLRKVLKDATTAFKDCKDSGNGGDDGGATSAAPTSAAGTATQAPPASTSAAAPTSAAATPTVTTPPPAEPTESSPAKPTSTGAAGALAPAGAVALVFAAALL